MTFRFLFRHNNLTFCLFINSNSIFANRHPAFIFTSPINLPKGVTDDMKTILRHLSCLCLLVILPMILSAQAPRQLTSSEIYEKIQKLGVLGSVVYLAAHPDDENTRLISYLANELKVDVTYLSLTRGDGGQNLIGPEIAELLGVIRTQELLAARRLDGGHQLFSRANDFGFSKNPDETLRIWNEKEVLSDVIWAIRKCRPDIIINRFSHDTPGRTHGHHTASAMLGFEAFDLSGRKDVNPEQLKFVQPWQARRLFFNTSWWFFGSREAFEKADKSDMVSMDVGVFFPLKGKSNTEIAAESRSMHRCQGMGTLGARGSEMEYLKLLKGDMPSDRGNMFAGIDLSWNRVKGGAAVGMRLQEIQRQFDFSAPWKSVPALVELRKLITALPSDHWTERKSKDLDAVILASLGLFAEVIAPSSSATPGEDLELKFEIIQRGQGQVALEAVELLPLGKDSIFQTMLPFNKSLKFSQKITLPSDLPLTNSYWLNEPWELGMFTVETQQLRGLPETPHPLRARWKLQVYGYDLVFETEVIFKKEVSERGEVYQPFEITPPVFANIAEKAYVFGSSQNKPVKVRLKAGKANVKGQVRLELPEGWRVQPESIDFDITQKGAEKVIHFELSPPDQPGEGALKAIVTVDGLEYDKEIVLIEYEHIPTQTILRTNGAKISKIDLKTVGTRVGYVMGAGDEIPASLQQIGYQVSMLDEGDLTWESLRHYDAVILGVRAYNTKERLKYAQPGLMEYVKNGGTVIVQYNTNFELVTNDIGPFPIKLSRERVTVEEAEMRFLLPEHTVLHHPNKITAEDFKGWVQERGLYFPGEWATEYEAILSCNDPGEPARDGSLLVGRYGDGYYVYTGLAFFRQLPAGVPGAYRLFANLISIGRDAKP